MNYRNEIDGLRALAVMPIVLFHAGVQGLPGGFIGVDIFFVISGYLITSIITHNIETGTFSLGQFYVRRIVRIFPALLTMLAVVTIAGAVLLFPNESRSLSISAAAAATFVSNIYFWRAIDYFAPAAETHALLHTWSLGVEEQFYIFFPLLLLLAHRYRSRATVRIVIVLVLASLAVSLFLGLTGRGKTAFYVLPSRMWELGVGALIALNVHPKISGKLTRSGLSLLGIAAILVSTVYITPSATFPVPWALLPCLGAALIIAYSEHTPVAGLLSLAPLRWIGLVSYSLYLWHWPIIVFYRTLYGATLSPNETIGLIVLSLAMAVLSYALVEHPTLRAYRRASTRPVLLAGLGSAGAIAALFLALAVGANSLRTYGPEISSILAMSDYRESKDYELQFRPEFCFIEPTSRTSLDPSCLALSDTKPNLIVVGDSFGAHFWRAFAERFPERNVMQATAPSCRPTLNAEGTSACREIMDKVFGAIASSGRLDAAVLIGRWLEADLPKLVATVKALRSKGVRVLVVGPSVEYHAPLPELIARSTESGNKSIIQEARNHESKRLSNAMRELVLAAGGAFVSPYDLQCEGLDCAIADASGAPANFDCCHLTLATSRELVRRFPEP